MPTIPLLTGRFGVQVPGGAHSRTGPDGPVLCVSRSGALPRPCSAARVRSSRTFDSRTQAETWIATQQLGHRIVGQLTVRELDAWRHRQQQRTADGSDNVHGLVFTTRPGRPVDQRNVSRAFHRARTAAGVEHGSLKTFRSTVATQLAEAGLHPSKSQAFLGHAHVATTLTYYTAITDVDEVADLLPDLH